MTRFKERFFDPVLRTDRGRMPDPVISFYRIRREILAAYTLIRNPQGLLDEITFNTAHFFDIPDVGRVWEYGEWGLLETALHEQIHLWQQNFGKHPVTPGRAYHNAEFVAKCESVGLHPRLGSGCHWKPADGLFAVLMHEYGIAPPEAEEVPPDKPRFDWWDWGRKPKVSRHLTKWQCDCGCNVRVGMKEWPGAVCNRCGSQYHRVENGVPLVLFDANAVAENMSWHNHREGIYQPKIHSERIHELHEIVVLTGEPMTILVDIALEEFIGRYKPPTIVTGPTTATANEPNADLPITH